MTHFSQELSRNLTSHDVDNECKKLNKKPTDSFNQATVIYCQQNNYSPKKIIVGTLTPQKNKGFFYTASNTQLDLIDSVLGSNLVSISRFSNNIQKDLMDELKKYNLAFLDVIEKCVDNSKSNSDESIEGFCLDRNSFDNPLFDNSEFICNSKNAEKALKKIKDNIKSLYAPQYKYRRSKSENSQGLTLKQAILKSWKNVL